MSLENLKITRIILNTYLSFTQQRIRILILRSSFPENENVSIYRVFTIYILTLKHAFYCS